MNNIEILKNAIKCNKKQFEEIGTHILLQDDEMKAIENLIQENKELKERIKGLECEIEIKKYCKVDEVINDLTYYKNLAKEYQGNCIPKSKVKEKIEEIKNKMNNDCIALHGFQREAQIDILQELLEEGE